MGTAEWVAAPVEVIDCEHDLNAYAKVESQAACCTPPASSLPIAKVALCSTFGESFDPSMPTSTSG